MKNLTRRRNESHWLDSWWAFPELQMAIFQSAVKIKKKQNKTKKK